MTWLNQRHDVQIPKILHSCPIIEAVVDFQFESTVPDAAVFGAIYNRISATVTGQVTALPITQMPEQLRNSDPNLRIAPHYRIADKNYLLQIGPHNLNFIMTSPYQGWDVFSSWISQVLELAAQSNVIGKITRVGVRFINAFEGDALPNIKLQSVYMGDQFPSEEMNAAYLFTEKETNHRIQISTKNQIFVNSKTFIGTVLDIDTFRATSVSSLDEAFEVARDLHEEEKKTFFALIEDSYIETFKPEYQ